MEPRDDDIEFDFFDDEPATGEPQQPARAAAAPRASDGPGRAGPSGPPRGLAPLLRLLGLVVVAIAFVVLVFALLIKSCAARRSTSAYASYMDKVATIATQSTANGSGSRPTLDDAGRSA